MPHKDMHHFKHAMLDPQKMYDSPADIILDDELSYKEKVSVLKHWAEEMKHSLETGARSVRPGGDHTSDKMLLQQIIRAARILEENEP